MMFKKVLFDDFESMLLQKLKNEAKIIVFRSFHNAFQQKNASLAPYKTGENML